MHNHLINRFIVLAILGVCSCSGAASFEQKILDARQLLDKGDADAAINLLKEAQVDYPDASELRFGIACALFAKGETLLKSGAAEESKAAFKEARSMFNDLEKDPNAQIAREATFNGATTVAREALGIADSGDYAAGVDALRGAVEAYEAALTRYPDHPEIRQNLDHVQFKLKQCCRIRRRNRRNRKTAARNIALWLAATDIPGAQAQMSRTRPS